MEIKLIEEMEWVRNDREGAKEMWCEICGWINYEEFDEEWNERLEEEWK